MTLYALLLVLIAAFIHASWNLLAKQIGGGATFVWMTATTGALIFLPITVLLGTWQQVAWGWQALLVTLGSGVIQTLYFVTLQRGYQVGDLSLVYPLARGTGPLFATSAAILLLGERPTPLALSGALLVVGGVFTISSTAPRASANARWAVDFGLLTGVFIATYTVWDKIAVSALLIPPLLLDTIAAGVRALLLTPIGVRRWPEARTLWRRRKWGIVAVAIMSELAYVLVLTAMQTTPVSYVAPAREVSILIGTVLGVQLLAEGHLRQRLLGGGAILLGIVALAVG
jgi:uncharacterized membrane protein